MIVGSILGLNKDSAIIRSHFGFHATVIVWCQLKLAQPSNIHTPTPILSNRVHARTARSEMSFWYADANKIYAEQNLDGPEKDPSGLDL